MTTNNSEPSKKAKELQSLRSKIKRNPYKRSEMDLKELVNENPSIDLVDIEILSALQIDGRASFNTLAEILGLSVSTVSSRVAKLVELKIIKGFAAVVSCEGLGFSENLWLMIYLEPDANVSKIGAQITPLVGVRCVYSIFSDFDLLAHICCGTSKDIENAIEIIGKIKGITKVTKMAVRDRVKEDFRVQI